MNKLPTKQIYLLIIIIVGIIALSIYSTYAIFTFEGSTSNIVSLYTPNSLKINESVSEYQQVPVDASSYTTTDIDIYNTHDYEVCYSVWYKLINSNNSLTKIYQITKNTASSSSTLCISILALTIVSSNIFLTYRLLSLFPSLFKNKYSLPLVSSLYLPSSKYLFKSF